MGFFRLLLLFFMGFFGLTNTVSDKPENDNNRKHTKSDQNSRHSVAWWPTRTYVGDLGACGCIGADADFNREVVLALHGGRSRIDEAGVLCVIRIHERYSQNDCRRIKLGILI